MRVRLSVHFHIRIDEKVERRSLLTRFQVDIAARGEADAVFGQVAEIILLQLRIAIRSSIDRKDVFSTGARMHLELDVAVRGKDATQDQFIDAVLAARKTCLATPLPEFKLRLTAQLELDT